MMFDPPDFPYKELADSLRENYSSDELLLNNPETIVSASNPKTLAEVTEQMISNVESQLSFNSNDSGRYFNIENAAFLENSHNNVDNAGLYTVQPPENMFNYEPTLLDENTVNQFLLPLQTSEDHSNKDSLFTGPDLLALHSCVICHDIFATESDLLNHTICVHASDNIGQGETGTLPVINEETVTGEENTASFDIQAEWLVCTRCERVLSTGDKVETNDQICCVDLNGESNVRSFKLSTMYVCDYCSGLFAESTALDRHRLVCYIQGQPGGLFNTTEITSQPSEPYPSDPEVSFPCRLCGKQCTSLDELKSHTMICQRSAPRRTDRRAFNHTTNNKMWNCGSCNQLFTTARELYRHKRGEDRPPGAPFMAYVCEECDKVLGSMCALHTHKKMHKVSKPGYPCRVCGRRFNQSGHLAIHMRMHTGERPYPCDLCPKAFKVKVERDDHRRTHTGERPFACTACPKTFTAAARLREHARIHTDQRPYRCEICGAAFRRPYARTVHTLIHTGEKPHECDVCGTAFRRSGDMWKHKRTLHGIQANGADS